LLFQTYIGQKVPEDFLKKSGFLTSDESTKELVKPIYNLQDDGSIIDDIPKEVTKVLKLFGHQNFRSGQDRAIMRILSGQSTLVTLSTGSGKSLCYQLPAYMYRQKYHCITLVVSPLVSLMEDQVHGIPSFINAQCLHTNQTPK
jgi:ATP-dependent DNA helicase Q4